MRYKIILIILAGSLVFSCKSKKESAPAAKSGINTSRSNIKNDVDTTKSKTPAEKK